MTNTLLKSLESKLTTLGGALLAVLSQVPEGTFTGPVGVFLLKFKTILMILGAAGMIAGPSAFAKK
jgi:hypothetical protein